MPAPWATWLVKDLASLAGTGAVSYIGGILDTGTGTFLRIGGILGTATVPSWWAFLILTQFHILGELLLSTAMVRLNGALPGTGSFPHIRSRYWDLPHFRSFLVLESFHISGHCWYWNLSTFQVIPGTGTFPRFRSFLILEIFHMIGAVHSAWAALGRQVSGTWAIPLTHRVCKKLNITTSRMI